MIHKLKILALALVAVLAMSAVFAAAAQATNLTSAKGNYPVSLHAGQTGTHTFVINGRTVTCASVTFTRSLAKFTENQAVTPAYENCHVIVFGATWPVTMTTEGCTHTLTETPADEVTIDCPTGKNIDIHVFTSHANLTAGTSACTYHMGPQTISAGVSIANNADGQRVDVSTASSPVALALTSGSTVTCGQTNQTGSYTGSSTYSGSFSGNPEGIHFGVPSSKLTSIKGNHPVALHAGQVETHTFVINGRTVTCSSVTFTGSLAKSTENQAVNPAYEHCHVIVFGATWPVTFTAEGCAHILSGSIADEVTIDCPTGKNIDIHVFTSHANLTAGTSACTYHMGPQTISAGVSIANNADGQRVDVSTASSPVALALTSGSTVTCGQTNQTGSYTGSSTYSGSFTAPEAIHLNT